MSGENDSLDFRPFYGEAMKYLELARESERALLGKEAQLIIAMESYKFSRMCLNRAYGLIPPDETWEAEILRQLEHVKGRIYALKTTTIPD